jgi:hypothetical protein
VRQTLLLSLNPTTLNKQPGEQASECAWANKKKKNRRKKKQKFKRNVESNVHVLE